MKNHGFVVARPLTAIVLATVAGAVLRFQGLGSRDFWFDESCTFRYVDHLFDWPGDSSLLVESTNLPYYLALRGWVRLFGDSEAAYRSLSALAAAMTVPLLSLAAYRLAGSAAAVVCAVLTAFHPLHIHYAHEARAYALWLLLLTLSLVLLVEAARRQRWRWWVGYGTALLTCLFLHYFTVYWVPATLGVLALALASDRRRTLRQWQLTAAAVLLAFMPYVVVAIWPAARQGGSAWITPHWEPLLAIPRTLWAFLPAGGYPAHLRGLSILSPDTVVLGPQWLTALSRTVPAVVVIVVFAMLARRGMRGGGYRPAAIRVHIFLGAVSLAPLVLAWLYSLLVRPNYLVGRYDLVAWPGMILWQAVGIALVERERPGRVIGWPVAAICTVLVACSLLPIARMTALKPPPTFHNLRARELARLTAPGDLVIALSYDRDYLTYYLHRAGFRTRMVSFPSWLEGQVGWVDTAADLAPGRARRLQDDANDRVELVLRVKAAGGRVFLLADSIGGSSSDPRAPITEVLLTALRHAGLEPAVVDEGLLILELTGSGG